MKQSGQSLISILVALSVSVVLLMLLLSILTNAYANRRITIKEQRLVVASEYILNDFTQRIHWSEDAEVEDGRLVLTADGEETEIFLSGTSLYNSDDLTTPVNPSDVEVVSFEVADRSPNGLPLIWIDIQLEHENKEPRIRLQKDTAISARKAVGFLSDD